MGAATTMSAKDFSEAKGANVASAATTTIWATDGNFIHITGTTTITSFGTAEQAGDERTIVFDGALTLTHNSTSLILPSGANITTAAGDTAIVRAETTANARVIAYLKKDGTAVVGATVATQAQMEAATNNTAMVTPLAVNWNPGVAKGWASWTISGGTPTLNANLNVSSLTDNGVGDFTINWTTAFSSANYVIVGTVKRSDSGGAGGGQDGIIRLSSNPATGSVRVGTADNSGSLEDVTFASYVAFGDQ